MPNRFGLLGYANRPSTAEGKVATIVYALFGIPIMLLFLSTIGHLLGRGLKFLYGCCCACSAEAGNPLIDDHEHRHHLPADYQVHHIALNNIANSSRPVVNCNNSGTLLNHGGSYQLTTGKNSFAPLSSTYTARCSCELDAEGKLCPDPVITDHLSASPYTGHSHTYLADPETSVFYSKDHLGRIHSHTSLYEEGVRDTVPFYFCFLLIVVYILGGSILFYAWEGWSLLDGAYFCFVTLRCV